MACRLNPHLTKVKIIYLTPVDLFVSICWYPTDLLFYISADSETKIELKDHIFHELSTNNEFISHNGGWKMTCSSMPTEAKKRRVEYDENLNHLDSYSRHRKLPQVTIGHFLYFRSFGS